MESYPSDYVPRFTGEDVLRRFQFLSERCQRYIGEMHGSHPTWRLRFDHLVMLNVAQSAMDDIWRYKSYHLHDPDKRSDAVKRSAFLTKWIIRLRPIYYARILSVDDPRSAFDKKDTTLLANEGFAIHVSLTTLATEIGQEEILPEQDFLASFLYDLHYRSISEDALIALYEIIRNAALNKSVVLNS